MTSKQEKLKQYYESVKVLDGVLQKNIKELNDLIKKTYRVGDLIVYKGSSGRPKVGQIFSYVIHPNNYIGTVGIKIIGTSKTVLHNVLTEYTEVFNEIY